MLFNLKTGSTILFSLSVLFCNVAQAKSIPVDQRDAARVQINQTSEEIIAAMVEDDPGLKQVIEESAGHMTGVLSSGTILVIGGASGIGVIYDKHDDSRTYINIKRGDIGAGLGVGRYRYLVVFNDRESLLQFKRGTTTSTMGREKVAGERGKAVTTSPGKNFSIHILSDGGATVSATLRLLKISINHDLTNTGVANVSIPMTGFNEVGKQGDDAPRIWDHKLPFLAQKVLDEGYDLPLPYGVGLIYAYVDQDQLLKSLQVGLNDNEIVPFEFVSFENAISKSESWQMRLETWLFPFMNVYAMAGTVDGDAPLDVILDGDKMLDHLGTDCSNIIKPPLCKLLDGQTITLPIDATFSGKTYSLGMVLAGGWSSYFVTIPVNWTWVDMDTTDADGTVLTVTPRVGKVINLGDHGNLALFVGGNYLDSELTVTGRYALPDDQLSLDYIIEQENTDKWNAVIGANWDINRHWSVTMEYDGFFGSREAYIAALTWRF